MSENDNPAGVNGGAAKVSATGSSSLSDTKSQPSAQRRWLDHKRQSEVVAFEFGGHHFRATGSRYPDGTMAEVFLDTGKFGSAVQEYADNCAVLASIALQFGVPVESIRHSVTGPIARALDLLGGAR